MSGTAPEGVKERWAGPALARGFFWAALIAPPIVVSGVILGHNRGLLSLPAAGVTLVLIVWMAALAILSISSRRFAETGAAQDERERDVRALERYGSDSAQALAASELEFAALFRRASGESAEQFRNIADIAPVHLWTIDAAGQCTFVNKAWLEFSGRTLQEELGTGWMTATHPEGRQVLGAIYQEGVRRREPFSFEWLARRHDGVYRWCVAWQVPIFDDDGGYAGIVGSGMDVTDRRTADEELRRLNQELWRMNRDLEQRVSARTAEVEAVNRRLREVIEHKSEFLASMSHELRTPLNGIIGFAELIHDSKAGPVTATQREYLDDVLASGHHLLRLVSGLLDLAAIDAGKIQFNPEAVDLAQVVNMVRDALRSTAELQGVSIVAAVEPSIGDVVLDPTRLKQVLFNYVSNALKHTPPGGVVTVRAVLENVDSFRLDVEDMGPGIRDEDIPRLFKDFEQIRTAGGRASAGTGLGLALTRRLVEAQGGSVGLHTTISKGSTFFARFPRNRPEQAA